MSLGGMFEFYCTFQDATHLHANNNNRYSEILEPIFQNHTKQIAVEHHFIKEELENRVIALPHLPSRKQLTNLVTKVMAHDHH